MGLAEWLESRHLAGMRTALLALLLALAACDTYGEDHVEITQSISSVKGQPLSAAMKRFGLPTDQNPIGDQTVYIWRRGNVFAPGVDEPLQCEVRLLVDKNATVVGGEHHGNNYACSEMLRDWR